MDLLFKPYIKFDSFLNIAEQELLKPTIYRCLGLAMIHICMASARA